jgi:hypothetical protein
MIHELQKRMVNVHNRQEHVVGNPPAGIDYMYHLSKKAAYSHPVSS